MKRSIWTVVAFVFAVTAMGLSAGSAVAAPERLAAEHMPPPLVLVLDPETVFHHVPAPVFPEFRATEPGGVVINFLPGGAKDTWNNTCITWPEPAKTAFNRAADIWSMLLNPKVPVVVQACWTILSGSTLGVASPGTFYRDFAGAPTPRTWYPVSLANHLHGEDLNGENPEMHTSYNAGANWYFGIGGNPGFGQIDFLSVVLHEIGHGLGFTGSMSVSGGLGRWGFGTGFPVTYDHFTVDGEGRSLIDTSVYANNSAALATALTSGAVFFVGPNAVEANNGQPVKLFAPNPWQGGSSYSHLDNIFNNTEHALMTPSINPGTAIHHPGSITLGLLDDIGWAEPVVIPSEHTTWIQVGAHAPGLHGSQWRTDLGLRNVSDDEAAVDVRFHPAGGGSMRSMNTEVAAGAQVVLGDVVGQIGATGSGAIEVVADQLLVVTSRTYNQIAGGAACTPDGTFGQYFAGYAVHEGLSLGESAWLAHLAESNRFRSNLAFTNMSGAPTTVEVELFDGAGALLSSFPLNLNPGQYRQEVQVFKNRAGQTNMPRGSARVTVSAGAGVIASASVVDNTTNDPTTIPMVLYPAAPGSSVWLQVGARASGLHGSQWRTDLGLRNTGSAPATVQVRFYPAGGGAMVSSSVQVAAGAQSVLEDVVGQLGATGSGAMEVVSSQPTVVTSRTYNQLADTAECTPGGTFGQYYAGFRVSEGMAAGESAWLAHLAESDRFRSNLAFTNTGDTRARFEIELFGAAGNALATFAHEIDPGRYHQEGRVFFRKASQSAMNEGSARVTVTHGTGVIVSASVVDNITNDPTTIPALMPVEAPECAFQISPTSRQHPAEASSGNVAVTTPGGCPWTATSNAPWVAITGGAPGRGPGALSYSVTENTSGGERTGTLTIAGLTFTITQGAPGEPLTITQSNSMELAPGSVACTVSGASPQQTQQNQYLRAFTLTEHGIAGSFEVARVNFGIESLTRPDSAATTFTVNLYEKGENLAYADLTLIGTGTGDFEPQSQTLVFVDVTGTAPAGSTLVVEIVTPDLTDKGSTWIGSNPYGQSGPTYLASSGCGIENPTDVATIGDGFPDMMLVMSVEGMASSTAGTTNVILGDPTGGRSPWAPAAASDGTLSRDRNRSTTRRNR